MKLIAIIPLMLLQLSADSVFEKVLFVPLEAIYKVIGKRYEPPKEEEKYDETKWDFTVFDIAHFCIDSTGSGYCVGPFDHGEGKKVFLNGNGEIAKEYQYSFSERYWWDKQYRWLDTEIYYSVADMKEALVFRGDRIEIVENPWHPEFIRMRFPGVHFEYVESEDNILVPLFRITSRYIYSIKNREAVLSVYSRKTLRLIKEIPLHLPGRFRFVFCDLSIEGEKGDSYFRIIDFVRNFDPLLHVSEKGIFFWRDDYYDINQKKFTTIEGNPIPWDRVWSSGEVGGFTYYVRDETVFYIYSTEEGVYVFRYKGD